MTDTASLSQVDKGMWARIVGVVVAPTATFQAVVQDPRPASVLFLVCLVMSIAIGLPQFTERGRQASVELQVQQREQLTGQPLSPEQRTQVEGMSKYLGYLSVGSIFVGTPVVCLFFALLYWALFNTILGGAASLKQLLGVVAHASVIGAVGAALSAPIQYLQGVQTTTGPFNLGALVPMLPSESTLFKFFSGISFFMLWQVLVTSIGLAVLYRRRSTGIAIGLTLAYLAITAAFTVGFSLFTSR